MSDHNPASGLEDRVRVGAMNLAPATGAIEPFQVSIPQEALDDLKRRLEHTRWPNEQPVGDWSQGVPLEKARTLIEYWRDHYDWRRFEAKLNSFSQFRTKIDGLGIHFIHVKSKHPDALPIIMTHGWPGSVIEFLDIIGPLTDPTAHGGRAEDAFDVVVPSLPGFGFSDQPTEVGWSVHRTAKAWGTLMQRLGYKKWVAQGGDWGSGVTHMVAIQRPEGLAAAHVNLLLCFPHEIPEDPTPEEKAAFERNDLYKTEQSGYYKLQASTPQTLAYALADSPSGQAAWIYERFFSWTDNQGQPEDALSVDTMLDDITLYWLTDSAGSSARFYWESVRNQAGGGSNATGALTAWEGTDNDVLKIVDIGFVQSNSGTIGASLDFAFNIVDGDADQTATQHILVDIGGGGSSALAAPLSSLSAKNTGSVFVSDIGMAPSPKHPGFVDDSGMGPRHLAMSMLNQHHDGYWM
jgi:pimeloyl-ACP methyl ester carboxylesterase